MADGLAPGVRQIRSPNCDGRPAATPISLVVIHGISLPPGDFGGDGVERLFTNRSTPTRIRITRRSPRCGCPPISSCGVTENSSSSSPARDRAWHAGQSSWRGRARCNDYSIGIELEGTDTLPYAAVQYTRLSALLRALARRYPLDGRGGHSDIAPGRKSDPGPAFDWDRLARLTGVRRL